MLQRLQVAVYIDPVLACIRSVSTERGSASRSILGYVLILADLLQLLHFIPA